MPISTTAPIICCVYVYGTKPFNPEFSETLSRLSRRRMQSETALVVAVRRSVVPRRAAAVLLIQLMQVGCFAVKSRAWTRL